MKQTDGKTEAKAAPKPKTISRIFPRTWGKPVIIKEFGSTGRKEIKDDGLQPNSQEEFDHYMRTGEFVTSQNRPVPLDHKAAAAEVLAARKREKSKDAEIEKLKAELEAARRG